MAGRVFMEFIIEFIALFAASNKALLLFSSGLCGNLLPLLVPKKEPGTDSCHLRGLCLALYPAAGEKV